MSPFSDLRERLMQFENRSPANAAVVSLREGSSDVPWLRARGIQPSGSRSSIRVLARPSVLAWIASLASLPGALWSRVLRDRERRRIGTAWDFVDDRTLRDIGVSRHDIELLGGEHRWR
jgi:uncharacterized protein YjiS (DUF1127 family)